MHGSVSYTHLVPLQSGDGLYTFRVLQNTDGNKYVEIFSAEKQVELEDEFAPFVRPNVMVNFDEQSVCVQKARELAEGIRNDAQFVASVYDYLKNAITYDYAFAQSNPTMYYPDPDTTLETGKGICFDYAAVAAAMLRSLSLIHIFLYRASRREFVAFKAMHRS